MTSLGNSFNPRTRAGCDNRRGLICCGRCFLSIHAPARGATAEGVGQKEDVPPFNPRTRAGCDGASGGKGNMKRILSIHAPARGATPCNINDAVGMVEDFQSTHPRGVRRAAVQTFQMDPDVFQSTHPRGVRRLRNTSGDMTFGLSIHAPARGATLRKLANKWCFGFFQSTHPRGVRLTVEEYRAMMAGNFQSTHPRGVRQATAFDLPRPSALSIHAPARGATALMAFIVIDFVTAFNPRTRAGCDFEIEVGEEIEFDFQSTHPRGVRRYPLRSARIGPALSIHAPARGATGVRYKVERDENGLSIHAPARGATQPQTLLLP